MAITSKIFSKCPQYALTTALGNITTASNVKTALYVSASFGATQTMTTQTYTGVNAAPSTEVTQANGYTTTGVATTGTSTTASLITTGGSANAVWTVTGAGFTFRYAVVYNVATDYCYTLIDMGTDVTVVAGTLTLDYTAGLFTITVA